MKNAMPPAANTLEIREFLQEFEKNFDPVHPERSGTPVNILGFGEISTVIAFDLPEHKDRAYKRLPLFASKKEAQDYCRLYLEYNGQLTNHGVDTPESHAFHVEGHNGLYVAYLGQEKLDPGAIGNKILHSKTNAEINTLFRLILHKMMVLWRYNRDHAALLLGLDSQISNWAIRDFDPDRPITENTQLYFIDTSTPFMRKNGVEQMNARLFLQSAPKPMRWILDRFFLEEIMDRYYNFRLVAIDLLANLFKEQRPDLIPECIGIVNEVAAEFLEEKEITFKEVEAYYKEDKFIWQLFLAVRRADRLIHTRVLGKRYEFTLPGKIKR